jgi:hypothetical protein
VNREVGYFRFNGFILKNLLANHTKPVLLDTILTLQSDIAQLLYVYLDLIMADKQRYERRSKELFDDVGLEGVEYRKPSVRRRILVKVLTELRGRLLTTGVLASARLERTKDRKDYKAIFRKAPLPLKYALPNADTDGDSQDTSLSAHAAHLVRYFHQRFHPEDEIIVEPRELKTATELIANYGVERVKFIVDYVYTRTDFRPSFFGGVRSHAKRAISAYDEEQERQVAETAAAACQLCNNNGFILFRTPSGETFSTPCFHDLGYIRAREQDEGLTYLS